MNIIFIYPRKMATTEEMYKVFTSEAAKKHGINAEFVNSNNIKYGALKNADVLVFVRCLDYLSQNIIRSAKKAGIFTIQYFDDDLLNLPKSSVNRVQHLPWRKRAIKQGFQYTDAILSSNIMLAQKYAEMIPSKRFVSMDTPVDSNLFIPLEERDSRYHADKVKIVFAAGANHEEEFNQLVAPALPKLFKKFGDKISITFFGVHPDLSNLSNDLEIKYVDAMPLAEYRKAIQEGFYDIGLSPLRENEVTKYKYFNKYIEYTIAGMVGIYSNVLPYTLAVRNEINGFLADNTPEDWQNKLEQAVEDVDLRQKCYRNAYDSILSNMNSEVIFDKLLNDIPELIADRKHHSACVLAIKLKYMVVRVAESIYLVLTYLSMTGIKGAYKKICSYIAEQKEIKKELLG